MKKLTPLEAHVILSKGTEPPYSGKYNRFNKQGDYACKQCGSLLYHSSAKFDSGSGWPSFDDEITGAIKRVPDPDGHRTEIVCQRCGAHLGHVFQGERLTPKNTRHCVNSIALNFIPKELTKKELEKKEKEKAYKKETAIFAGGCFWGVEHLMKQLPGIISIASGYIGGHTSNPCYEEVCTRNTGHAEAVEIIFDPKKVSYETLAKHFFEIHDPEQLNRQGPDSGEQYRSEIFYTNPEQKEIALKLIKQLKNKGFQVVTTLTPA
ncbi:peptide-methionine (S)-S-oxide reductase, partial [Rickettsiella grylli]|uniref:bifunctional methionine sulfoxide reductase B/A protein n=1 Tax=Rickettsiella grylli TaxID=59196 RepID=UPI0008FD1DCB